MNIATLCKEMLLILLTNCPIIRPKRTEEGKRGSATAIVIIPP